MAYRVILAQAGASEAARMRMQIAAALAHRDRAHLIGAGFAMAAQDGADLQPLLQGFDALARKADVTSFEPRLIGGSLTSELSLQGRYCDLMILGQGEQNEPASALPPDFLEYVILNSACPVLTVPGNELRIGAPDTWATNPVGSRVLVAWNAGMAAARAVHDAMPFLLRARQVHVAVVNAAPGIHGEEPGADIALFLARHGIEVAVERLTADADPGRILLQLADRLSCNLLVMGCVAHPRGGGLLAGGTTRTALEASHLPVLMSH